MCFILTLSYKYRVDYFLLAFHHSYFKVFHYEDVFAEYIILNQIISWQTLFNHT